MKIILSGYMGSGKTGVGEKLSELLKSNFMDLDQVISEKEGKSIPEIFDSAGEIYFRRKETEVLKSLLEKNEDYILSLGGGTPCYGKNLQLLKENGEVTLVYLKTSLEELKRRLLMEKESRPVIAHLDTPEVLEDFIRKHLFERSFYYNQSDLIVTTDGKSVTEVSEEIQKALN